ncbi:methyltransferase [Amycolatopsis sp. NPDC051071]|uniref:methyltransferase n=1 Tax=Amycolatopsis sp. NPDC051071 TaxID=3154637 RepID=UPI0034216B19
MTHQDTAKVLDMVFGFVPAQIVRTMATLDLADRLAVGPVSLEELVKLTDCHEPSLRRLLRGAVFVGLLVRNEEGAYALTPAGQVLRADAPGSVKYLAMQLTGEPTWSACGSIEHTVRTGQPAVQHVFGQSGYGWMTDDPASQAQFYQSCTEVARQDVSGLVGALDLAGVQDIVDVGGGNGVLMAGLLSGNPGLSGTIFDQTAGLENTQATLKEAGVADRCTLIAGDFLADPLPSGRGAYVVKSVLCDWGDDDVLRILRACRQAMCADSTLFVIDMVLPEGDTTPDPVALMSDLCTLACGGAIRTENEFGALFAAAGLRLVEISGGKPGNPTNILRAVKS